LHWSVAKLAAGRSIAVVIAMQLVRFGAIGAAFAFVAIHWGALALLLSAGGVVIARAIALRLAARG